MKIFIISIFAFLIISCTSNYKGEDILLKDKNKSNYQKFSVPKELYIEKTIRNDFDNNLIEDYIYVTFSKETSEVREFWVRDNGELLFSLGNLPSQNDYFFVDLDSDKNKELIIFRGDDDAIDAQVAKVNIKEKKLETVFYFNPIVFDNNKYYWGYAWDIKRLITNKKNEVYSSYDKIQRDDDFKKANGQKYLPNLIFIPNKEFNPFLEIKISDINYHSLEEIIDFSKGNKI